MNSNMVSNSLYMQYINSEMPRLQEMKPVDRGKEVLTFQPDNSVVIKVEPELPGAFFKKEEEKEQCVAQKIDRNFMIPLTSFPKFDQPYYFPYDMQCPRPMNFDHGTCINWNEQFFGKPVQPMCQDTPGTAPGNEGPNCHRPRDPAPTDFCPSPVETQESQQQQPQAHGTPKRRNARKTPETPERRAARLAAAAERERRRRANETEEQRRIRREANARRSRMRRANEPEHLRKARLEANARRARIRRAAAAAAATGAPSAPPPPPPPPPTPSLPPHPPPTPIPPPTPVPSMGVPDMAANAGATAGSAAPGTTVTTTVTDVAALRANHPHPVVPVPPTNVPHLDSFASLLCASHNST